MRHRLRHIGRALAGAALPLLALLAPTLTLPSPALARAVTLEDLLQREGVGQAAFDPAGRWVVVERRGPYASGARFDLEGFNDIARTTLWAAPVLGADPLSPLFPAEPGAGYRLGPISPDGQHVAVYRLKGDQWRLGVASLADRSATWFDIAPELSLFGRALQWRSATELLVLTTPDGDLPRPLRFRNEAARKLPARWAASRDGLGAHTVFGGGRYLGARPKERPRALLRLDLASGRTTRLAEGDFTDLELSPDGRHVALLEAAEDIRLTADTPLQGDYGLATRRQRLRILDVASRAIISPDAALDVLPLLAWSPRAEDLLIYGRPDGEPWTRGALLRLHLAGRTLTPAAPGLTIHLDLRPELVRAGWLADDPVVFGKRAADTGPSWFRVTPHGLRVAPGVGVPPNAGVPSRLDRIPLALPAPAQGAPSTRPRPLAERNGVTLRTEPLAGGAEQLVLSAPFAARRLALLNPGLGDVDPPDVRRIVHPGPSGETLTSWLLVPARPAPEPQQAAPLVIIPYLGVRYPAPPAAADWRSPGPIQAASLLAAGGYAVLLPSLPIPSGAEDPAAGVADRMLALVDRIARDPALPNLVDPDRVALWGVSYGGYTVLSAITQTGRFKGAVALAAPSELTSKHGEFHPQWRVDPSAGIEAAMSMGWVETDQGAMKAPPWAAPERYIRNSPALQADRIRTPLLLLHGDQDNIQHTQAEAMFTALYRQDKDVQLVTYWGEGHAIRSPGNLRDLYDRAFRFFAEVLGEPTGVVLRDSGADAPGR